MAQWQDWLLLIPPPHTHTHTHILIHLNLDSYLESYSYLYSTFWKLEAKLERIILFQIGNFSHLHFILGISITINSGNGNNHYLDFNQVILVILPTLLCSLELISFKVIISFNWSSLTIIWSMDCIGTFVIWPTTLSTYNKQNLLKTEKL